MLDNLQLLFVYAPVMNVQMLLDGIFIGAVFALAAYGLALVWGVMNIKNLAQGDFVITGGYICWWLAQHGVDPFIGIAVAFVLMALLGGAVTLVTMIHHRIAKKQGQPEIPYGVAISIAALCMIGERYLNHFA